jgi:hypothetical protein
MEHRALPEFFRVSSVFRPWLNLALHRWPVSQTFDGTAVVESAPSFTVLAGIAGSGKTTAFLARYREALCLAHERSRPGTALWLSPTNRAQAEIRQRLLDEALAAAFRTLTGLPIP